jgi:rRNA processing protein Krr1/Pno1
VDHEIQLISDGDGLAVIGDPAAVERFLVSEELPSSKDLELPRLGSVLSTGAAAAQAGSEIAGNSGRWVKLTKESAHLADKYGLRTSSKTGLSTGVVKGNSGHVRGFVEFAKGPGPRVANPAMLAGAAGIMAQLAMQQAMNEITDYLATIDEKVDDVLRAQKDAVLAGMIGAGFVIEEAMTVREHVGRVSEVTWSKVQATSMTIEQTRAYALRQLDALAEKVEHKAKIGDLAKTSKEAESKVQEWLAVLARCFQLQDAIAVLELDRVLDASPDELDRHRLGLRAARQNRLELISQSTEHLMARMDAAAAGTADTQVLLHPTASRAVVHSSNHVAAAVVEFHGRLGIQRGRQSLEARRWVDAAAEVKDKALETGAEGVDAARRLGNETLDRARSVTDKLSTGIAERALRRRGDDEERNEEG